MKGLHGFCSSGFFGTLCGSKLFCQAGLSAFARFLHRSHDVWVGATAADVTAHAFPNIIIILAAWFFQQSCG
jgi:hypothetical protein